MKDIDVVKYLLNEVEEEQKKLEEYEKMENEARDKAEKEGGYYWRYFKWEGRKPSKATINENLKKIRKLCLKMYEGGSY